MTGSNLVKSVSRWAAALSQDSMMAAVRGCNESKQFLHNGHGRNPPLPLLPTSPCSADSSATRYPDSGGILIASLVSEGVPSRLQPRLT